MTVLAPTRLDDAVAALAADPSLTVLAGGTDLMVAVNYGQYRPSGVLSLRRGESLRRYFEPLPDKPVHFLSHRGAGYKFMPAVDSKP